MEIIILIAEHGLFQTKVVLKQGESTNRHNHHETHETYMVIEGEGRIVVGGKNIPVQPGSFVSIPVHTPHQITNDSLFDLVVLSTKNKQLPEDTFEC